MKLLLPGDLAKTIFEGVTHEDDQISSRNAIIGKNIKYIRITYNTPSKISVIVGSDKFEEGTEDPFEDG